MADEDLQSPIEDTPQEAITDDLDEQADREDDLVDLQIESSAAAATVAVQLVEFDLPCIKCGYNLKSISRAGQCPECGRFVSMTLRDRENWPAGAWLKVNAGGIALLLAASVLATLASFWGSTAGAVLFGLGPAGGKLWLAVLVDQRRPSFLAITSIVLHVAGVLAITLPKDHGAKEEKTEKHFLLAIAAITLVIGILLAFGLFKWMSDGVIEYRVLPVLVLFEVICLVMEYLRLAKIAERVRRRMLPNLLRIVGGAQAIGLMLLLLWGLTIPSETVQWLTLGLGLIGALLGMLGCLWLLVVLIWRWRQSVRLASNHLRA